MANEWKKYKNTEATERWKISNIKPIYEAKQYYKGLQVKPIHNMINFDFKLLKRVVLCNASQHIDNYGDKMEQKEKMEATVSKYQCQINDCSTS